MQHFSIVSYFRPSPSPQFKATTVVPLSWTYNFPGFQEETRFLNSYTTTDIYYPYVHAHSCVCDLYSAGCLPLKVQQRSNRWRGDWWEVSFSVPLCRSSCSGPVMLDWPLTFSLYFYNRLEYWKLSSNSNLKNLVLFHFPFYSTKNYYKHVNMV